MLALSQMSLAFSAAAENHQAISNTSKSAAGTRELCTLHCEAKGGAEDGATGEPRVSTLVLVQKRALP